VPRVLLVVPRYQGYQGYQGYQDQGWGYQVLSLISLIQHRCQQAAPSFQTATIILATTSMANFVVLVRFGATNTKLRVVLGFRLFVLKVEDHKIGPPGEIKGGKLKGILK
jgi:hypothetical protein